MHRTFRTAECVIVRIQLHHEGVDPNPPLANVCSASNSMSWRHSKTAKMTVDVKATMMLAVVSSALVSLLSQPLRAIESHLTCFCSFSTSKSNLKSSSLFLSFLNICKCPRCQSSSLSHVPGSLKHFQSSFFSFSCARRARHLFIRDGCKIIDRY